MVYVSRSVIRGYDFLNVWIVPSAADFNQTEGTDLTIINIFI